LRCRSLRLNLNGMTFTFIHSADWHLGKPFGQFPDALSGELRAVRFDVIEKLASLARVSNATHVLVGGDVFDASDTARGDVLRALERMKKFAGVTWVLLPGNHDPLSIGGVWDRARRISLPANVVLIERSEPIHLTDNVALLPSPLLSKNAATDPTAWMDQAVTAPGVMRIGLAHGAVQDFSQDGDANARIAPDRAKRAGLSYLALGDWHGTLKVADGFWYAGTPEPDRFPDNDPGNALVVRLDGAKAAVDKRAVGAFQWRKKTAALTSAADLEVLSKRLAADITDDQKTLMQLSLTGHLLASEQTSLDEFGELWAARLKHLVLDTTELARPAKGLDLASLDHTPALRAAAETLSARSDNDPIAAKALLLLFSIAAEAEREHGERDAGAAA
jgi:DNA repair exonuclease SbcCD nuclease subunit